MTESRPPLVADCHTHLYPQPRRLYPRRTVTHTAADLIQRMGEFGVDISGVLAHPLPMASFEEGAAEHDLLARQVQKHLARLIPWCWAAPRWGSVGLAEIRRCIEQLGFRGIVVDPIQEGLELDDPVLNPICALAQELDVPIFVETYLEHCGAEPWRLVWLAERFPQVAFIMSHMGGIGLQQNMTGATLAAEVKNIYMETSCTKSDPFAIFEGPARILGPERVLLGSNGPLHHVALNLLKLELTRLTPDEKSMIRGLNFLQLIRYGEI